MKNQQTVAVLMGGNSAEREISLLSGQAIYDSLQRSGVAAVAIDTQSICLSELLSKKVTVAFIALHGVGGEDGSVQGSLQNLGIPYTGSGILGSALSLSKPKSKAIWAQLNLATPPCRLWQPGEDPKGYAIELGLPLAVKPIYEGSSLGISKVTQIAHLLPACEKAAHFGAVMLEPWIEGDEYTVGILGDQALPPIQIVAKNHFYDYQAKYHSKQTDYICPVNLVQEEILAMQQMALEAFKAVEASGWGRIDFIRDNYGKNWLLENNTVPGMTSHSLVPIAAAAAGLSFDELVLQILNTATLNNPKRHHDVFQVGDQHINA